jgi:2-polyprenyl-3-methyl-5-hydroxy-6-metoxy-1,4-benzoquinol methylase
MNKAPRAPHDLKLVTEHVACACCGESVAKRLYTERYTLGGSSAELGVNRCGRCGLVYVSPRLTEPSTSLVYELDADHTISNTYCWVGSDSERRFAPLLARLSKAAQPGQLLDVGCGGGQFLRAAKRTGRWQVIGVEPSADAAEQAARYAACEVRRTTLQSAGLPEGTFSVIAMLGVLEHVHDPIATLRLARTLLDESGVLAVYVPNFNYLRWKDAGLACYIRNGRWSKLHAQEHLFQYTPRTLVRILKSCGFEIVRIDVGKPFAARGGVARTLKDAAYWATCALKVSTGIHLGGIEVIAGVSRRSTVDRAPVQTRVSA